MVLVGIDLGTTHSAVASLDALKKPRILPNSEGQNTTPSVVLFEGSDHIVVGTAAKNAAQAYPDQTVQFAKHFIGENHEFHIGEDSYSPEEVSARILVKLREDADLALAEDEVTGAVITVPAIFGEEQRQRTIAAADIAGLEVVGILDEPVAAAIAYGLRDIETTRNQAVLVFDLGGGTFDVSAMRIAPDRIEMLHTGGDRHLGGRLWDDAVIDYVVDAFKAEHGIDPTEDAEAYETLRSQAEAAKRDLSRREKAVINCSCAGERTRVELTREKFDELTAPLLGRVRSALQIAVDEVAEKAGFEGWAGFDEVILVGGSSRMLQVVDMVNGLASCEVRIEDPDLIVAKGAALFAEMHLAERARLTNDDGVLAQHGIDQADVDLLPGAAVKRVCSFAIGNKTLVDPDRSRDDYVNVVLIEANSVLPATSTRTFQTVDDDQRTVRIDILEGDDPDPDDCAPLGTGQISGIPPGLPAGSPIDISISLTEESLISVRAVETTHGTSCDFEIRREHGLTKQQLESAKADLERTTVE